MGQNKSQFVENCMMQALVKSTWRSTRRKIRHNKIVSKELCKTKCTALKYDRLRFKYKVQNAFITGPKNLVTNCHKN